jgi:hypothetical protein
MTAAALPQSQEPYEVPNGGLASFLTATVGDWSDEALNSDNYYDIVKPTADQLAAFGREEDDRIAHVATGETVIPMAVFEEDPALKEALFTRMRDMGIDPERYVVGNELNSINPVTGQPEFFLKKIFKGIKKAVKGVVKVFKKVAPIVLSIGLAMTPLGPIAGAALGSGLGTLVQGGSLKDAFKSALIGGAMGGLSSGIGSVLKGGEFMAGVKSGLPTTFGGGVNPTLPSVEELASKVSEGAPVVDKALAEQVVSEAAAIPPAAPTGAPGTVNTTGPVNLLPGPIPGAAEAELAMRAKTAAGGIPQGATTAGYQGTPLADDAVSSALGFKPTVPKTTQTVVPTAQTPSAPSAEMITDVNKVAQLSAIEGAAKPSIFNSLKNFFTQPDKLESLKEVFFTRGLSAPDMQQLILDQTGQNVSMGVAKELAEELAPTILRSYGPLAAAGLGVMGLAGGFEQPEMETLGDGGFGINQRFIANPLAYRTYAQAGSGYNPPPVGAASGGGMDTSDFPRRDGAIRGPGTETSDDIPAMLSDGEFVMTAKAVRGAGNGSREAGMRKMYNMMSQFERAV